MQETIGERLRRLRLDKGWTQNVLGYHAGRAPSVISQVETEKREPELSTVKALAGALGVDWRYLLLGDETPKAQAPSTPGQHEDSSRSELDPWIAYVRRRAEYVGSEVDEKSSKFRDAHAAADFVDEIVQENTDLWTVLFEHQSGGEEPYEAGGSMTRLVEAAGELHTAIGAATALAESMSGSPKDQLAARRAQLEKATEMLPRLRESHEASA